MIAVVFIALAGAIVAIQFAMDDRAFDRLFFATWGFWAVAIVSMTAGYGLGDRLGHAFGRENRRRHLAPWLLILLICAGLSWSAGAWVETAFGRNEFPVGPILLLIAAIVGVMESRRLLRPWRRRR